MPNSEYPLHFPAILSVKVPSTDPSKPVALIRTSPVPSPSKVSPGQWHRGQATERDLHAVLTYKSGSQGPYGQCGAVYLIQRSSGCRIGEVLSLRTTDIILPDQLIIKALKGSRPRAIRLPELQDQFARLLSHGDHLLFSVSYSQVYRQYKHFGIVHYNPTNHNNRVTHSLRKNYIQAVQLVSKDVDITKDIVGHKSKRSTIIYLQKGTHNG